jgi:uncharacterized protein
MKKLLTFLIALTFLFLFVGSPVVFANNDLIYGQGAYLNKDYKTAYKLFFPLAEQGDASAQNNLGVMYFKGPGVPQDYVLAHMWWNLAGSNGNKNAVENRNIVEKKMSKQQIEKAQEMARNWKPKKK